jgi:hypothetical protein
MKNTNEILKKWADIWKSAGQALGAIKKNELADKDYYTKNIHFLDEMLCYAMERNVISNTSGLVEMQKYFMKLRNK